MHDASNSLDAAPEADRQPAEVAPGIAPAAGGLGSRALRNTALVLSARVGSRALALITVIAISNHLGDTRFGQYQTVVTYVALVTVLVDLGFNTLYVREAARRPGEAGRYLGTLIPVRAVMSLAALLVLAAVLGLRDLEPLLLPGFALMVLQSYAGLLRGTFYALQQLRYEAISIVLEGILLLALVVAGIERAAGIAYFIWAYAATYGFSCAFIGAVLLSRRMAEIDWRPNLALARSWLWNGLPFALTFVITTVYFKIDVPILQLFRPYAEVGWYALAYKPFEALLFVPVTMLNVVFPVLSVYFRDAPSRLQPAVERFAKSLVLLGWPLTVGTLLLAPGLTALLRLYPQSRPALEILALGIVFMFLNNAFIAALSSADRQVEFTKAALASLVVNVALNLALIPPFGYLGAAAATVLTEVFLVGAAWWLTSRHVGRISVLRKSWRIVLAGLLMGALLVPFRDLRGWPVLLAVGGGAAAYVVALVVLRAVDAEEMALIRGAIAGGGRL